MSRTEADPRQGRSPSESHVGRVLLGCVQGHVAAAPSARRAGVCADVRAKEDCTRRTRWSADHRRIACLRARRRCDLSEPVARLALQPRDRDQAADLLRRSLVADLDMVAGSQP